MVAIHPISVCIPVGISHEKISDAKVRNPSMTRIGTSVFNKRPFHPFLCKGNSLCALEVFANTFLQWVISFCGTSRVPLIKTIPWNNIRQGKQTFFWIFFSTCVCVVFSFWCEVPINCLMDQKNLFTQLISLFLFPSIFYEVFMTRALPVADITLREITATEPPLNIVFLSQFHLWPDWMTWSKSNFVTRCLHCPQKKKIPLHCIK